MTATSYAIEMTDRSPAAPGEAEKLSLLIHYAGDPVGAVTIAWHGDLELELNSSKFFGGKSPGIENAWQLADLVRRAMEAHASSDVGEAADNFVDDDGEAVIWEVTLTEAGGRSDA